MHLYLDDESRSRLEYLSRVSNSSMSEVLRQIIHGASVKEMPPADYHAMTAELYRIGTNLNQIARVANTTGHADTAAFEQLAAELRAAILGIQRAVDMR
ncbi:plasmid mobilization relaxosome protein MobC [Ruminococcaceae bacterium OttesenSCG-928-D13]|nr:plasmid mobilization relaxosome protein MobC [Ruminococcaceae bacterium OttesenSCG-928-D13]